MKYLTIIRHAEAEPSQEKDFARRLTAKGGGDAKALGLFFESIRQKKQWPKIDAVVASSAKRTTQTAIALAEGVQYPLAEIQFSAGLYHADGQDIFECLRQCGDATHVVWVGHNPIIESVCTALLWNDAEKQTAATFSPASFAVLSLGMDDWIALSASIGSLEAFASPPYSV